jgi:hypothetical protein
MQKYVSDHSASGWNRLRSLNAQDEDRMIESPLKAVRSGALRGKGPLSNGCDGNLQLQEFNKIR